MASDIYRREARLGLGKRPMYMYLDRPPMDDRISLYAISRMFCALAVFTGAALRLIGPPNAANARSIRAGAAGPWAPIFRAFICTE